MGHEQPLDISAGEGELAPPEGVAPLHDVRLDGAPRGEHALALRGDLRLGAPRLAECAPICQPIAGIRGGGGGGGGCGGGEWGGGGWRTGRGSQVVGAAGQVTYYREVVCHDI